MKRYTITFDYQLGEDVVEDENGEFVYHKDLTTNNKIKAHIFKYGGKEYYIPERMMPGIQRYIKKRIRPGKFLCMIICNDLKNAIGYADEENLENLPAFVSYFYNDAPHDCWGSKEKFEAWLRRKEWI